MDTTILLTLFILSIAIYFPLNKRASKYYLTSIVDKKIPYLKIFIIPYILFLPYILITLIVLWNNKFINPLLITLIIATNLANIFWVLFPNGVKRVTVIETSFLDKITNFIYRHDNDTNGFPSGHVFKTLICTFFLIFAFPSFAQFFLIPCVLIISSTVFTKQHYFIDVFGGILWFFLSLLISNIIINNA